MDIRNLIRDVSVHTVSVALSAVLSTVQAIIVARVLGPEFYGELHVYRLFLAYAAYTTLGTFWGMIREISFYRGQDDHRKIQAIQNATFLFNLLSSILTSIVVVALLLLWPKVRPDSMFEICIVAMLIVGDRIYGFATHYFMAVKKFMVRSALAVGYAFSNIIFVVALGYLYGLRGVLAGMLIAYVSCIIYSVKKGAIHFDFHYNKKVVSNLFRTGLPIFGNGILTVLISTVDRLMIVNFLPVVQLGYYGMAVLVKALIETLYTSIFNTIFPRLTERYGETKNLVEIKNYILKPLVVSAHFAPIFLGAMIIVVPTMVKFALPKYIPGVLAVQLIIAASFFRCLETGIMKFFIAINSVPKVYALRLVTIIFSVLTMWIAIKAGYGLEGVAFSFLLSSALLAGLLFVSFLGHYSISYSIKIKHFLSVGYPFFYMCIGLWCASFVNLEPIDSVPIELFNTILKLSVFLMSCVPLLVIINLKTGIFKELGRAVRHFYQVRMLKNGNEGSKGASV